MKRTCLIGICLFALLTSVGCCCRQGGVDPVTGMAYGGSLLPASGGPLDPLGFWWWISGGRCGMWNQSGGYQGSFGQMSPYGNSPCYSPYASYPPGAMFDDPCGGCGNAFPTFQGPMQGPFEYSYPPSVPPTERDDAKGLPDNTKDNAATTHFQTSWTTPVGDGTGVVAR